MELDELEAPIVEEQPTPEPSEKPATVDPTVDEADEVVVTIGDEAPPEEGDEQIDGQPAPQWVKELRKERRELIRQQREKDRKLKDQEAEIERLKGGVQPAAEVVVGDEPTLEGCDYDAAKFKAEWKAWTERKSQADAKEREKADAQRKLQEVHQARMTVYAEQKTKLKVSDFEDAEETVIGTLTPVQQSIVLHGADNPAVLVYALGKNPAKAKELAAMTDPVKFTFALAKLESQLKVQPRKPATQPERAVRSSVSGTSAVDNQLEKLRQEAAKTGDLSKVHAYKRQQRGR